MDASQFSTRHAIDAEFRYECAVMHVPLENLEYLGDIKHPTDSKLFREAAAELPRPFKALVSVVSTKNLRSPVLAEMFGAGYLALAKSDNDIVFKRIDGGAAATLTCIDQPTVAQSVRPRLLTVRAPLTSLHSVTAYARSSCSRRRTQSSSCARSTRVAGAAL